MGRLGRGQAVAGSEALKPTVEDFVDEEAGFDVGEKGAPRLQHFIDRKVATQFEPFWRWAGGTRP